MTAARFLDLSAYQGAPDFAALRADGIAFVVLKATDGFGADPRFLVDLSTSLKAGMRVEGAYHFLRAGRGAEQAQWHLSALSHVFAAELAIAAPPLTPIVDFEDAPGSVPSADDLEAWLDAIVAARRGCRPIVYCNRGKATRAGLASRPRLATLADLWLADWNAGAPVIPAPWTSALWRQTGAGREEGVAGPVDEDAVLASGGIVPGQVDHVLGEGGGVKLAPSGVSAAPAAADFPDRGLAGADRMQIGAPGPQIASEAAVVGHAADSAPADDGAQDGAAFDAAATLPTGAPAGTEPS